MLFAGSIKEKRQLDTVEGTVLQCATGVLPAALLDSIQQNGIPCQERETILLCIEPHLQLGST
jgi:hypothetical protein